jgi:hypothetical protein
VSMYKIETFRRHDGTWLAVLDAPHDGTQGAADTEEDAVYAAVNAWYKAAEEAPAAPTPREVVQEALRRRHNTPEFHRYPRIEFDYVDESGNATYGREVYPTRWKDEGESFFGFDTARGGLRLFLTSRMTDASGEWESE